MIDGDSIRVSLRTLRFLSGLCDTKVITTSIAKCARERNGRYEECAPSLTP